jgi:flagellar biosynthesis/type III secretory pathway protein FliH
LPEEESENFVRALFAPYGKRTRPVAAVAEEEEDDDLLGKMVVEAYLKSEKWQKRQQAMEDEILAEFERGKSEAYNRGKADGRQELDAAQKYLSKISNFTIGSSSSEN